MKIRSGLFDAMVLQRNTHHVSDARGIFLRFERLGLPKWLINLGPEHYAMPEWLG